MTAATAQPPLVVATKSGLVNTFQTLVYSAGLGQLAVGFWSGAYVLIFQAHYFGKSFKYTWDHLFRIWHFGAIPGIGHWLLDHETIARHLFARDVPEAVLGYALVAMIVPILVTKRKDEPPLLDKIMVRIGMPSPYQEQLGRHPDTSALQYLFLLPSMLLAMLPGVIITSAVIFLGVALAHQVGYNTGWLTSTAWWIPIAVGIAGGRLAGHKPAVKAGQDIQRFNLDKRLALYYRAENLMGAFGSHQLTMDQALPRLTRMRRLDPAWYYPFSYRDRYSDLLARHRPVRHYGLGSSIGIRLTVALVLIVGLWGVYLRKYGIGHGFWLPW